nr:serine/arginine-rich splicing factor RS31-like isoform X2 [Tanacetum cinerariifolium]
PGNPFKPLWNNIAGNCFMEHLKVITKDGIQGERNRHRDGSNSVSNQMPTKTLFVINFDPVHTRVRDIEKHFDPYRMILHVRIRRNFTFVQFETQEEATKALECTHMRLVLMQ